MIVFLPPFFLAPPVKRTQVQRGYKIYKLNRALNSVLIKTLQRYLSWTGIYWNSIKAHFGILLKKKLPGKKLKIQKFKYHTSEWNDNKKPKCILKTGSHKLHFKRILFILWDPGTIGAGRFVGIFNDFLLADSMITWMYTGFLLLLYV